MVALEVRENNMGLLTEVQIHEVAAIFAHRRDANIATIFHAIKEWNEKQQSFIEPNWKSLPSKVKYCQLWQYHLDADGNEIDWQFIISHARPVAAHPHAEVMAKYAEVAARRVDPWVEFQVYRTFFSQWVTLETPTFFDTNQQYRYIGDDK